MLEEAIPEHDTEYAAIRHVGSKLGVGPETLRKWRRRAEIDAGTRPGVTSDELAEVKPADLVQRRFVADGPRRLWVAVVTYVSTSSGFAYVAFVTEVYSRRIVGRNVAATLKGRHTAALGVLTGDVDRSGRLTLP